MVNVENKIEIWKNKLLDLGKRNKMLNFKETKRSTLKILTPEVFDLWEDFVVNENSLKFAYKSDMLEEMQQSQQESLFKSDFDLLDENEEEKIKDNEEQEIIEEYFENDGIIRTNQKLADMQKTLRTLRNKAKTATEEQGINILYLTFGMLEWQETFGSNVTFRSPLILVPVTITVDSITSPYFLNLHEDEIVLNPTLCYKLENDFGLKLPEFNEEKSLNDYLQEVRDFVKDNNWEVKDDVYLSTMSFLKINMYHDLCSQKETICNNPIIRAIAGDNTSLEPFPSDINGYDFDNNMTPKDTFQILDADSSQQEAILCAKRGVSFVLQGPPGTGKSQTITNIIAECLADGKKVLFVSEKMAALDVVHKRLKNSGLEDFCLVLHSYKANKKDVLQQLETTLDLASTRNVVNVSKNAFLELDRLEEYKQNLNEYSKEIFDIVQPLNKTIYEINGELAKLSEYKDVIFPIENIRNIDEEKFNKYIRSLRNLSFMLEQMSVDISSNPWKDTTIDNITNELRHDIGAVIPKLIDKLKEYQEKVEKCMEDASVVLPISCNNIEALIEIFSVVNEPPKICVDWVFGDDVSPLFEEINYYKDLSKEYQEAISSIKTYYKDISKLNNRDFKLDNLEVLNSCEGVKLEQEKLENMLRDNEIFKKISNTYSYSDVIKEKNIVKDKIVEIECLKEEILHDFEKDIFDVDYKDLLRKYRTDFTSKFKKFNKEYKNNIKFFQSIYKVMGIKITDEVIISAIYKLQTLDEKIEWLKNNCSIFRDIFSSLFNLDNTNMENIENYLTAYTQVKESVLEFKRVYDIIYQYETNSEILKQHYGEFYKGANTSWDEVITGLNWVIDFRKIINEKQLNREFVEKVCNSQLSVDVCEKNKLLLGDIIKDIKDDLNWFVSLFNNKDNIYDLEFKFLIKKLDTCYNSLSLLEEWLDYKHANEECEKEGLSEYMQKVIEEDIDKESIVGVFKKRFYSLWLDTVLPDYPAIANFRRINQDAMIKKFAALDTLQFEIAKQRVKSRLISALPEIGGFARGEDEVRVLKRELSKKRKIMPIRRLFRRIPDLVLSLKPCMMMSPLSVSIFLESEKFQFDTVIFDEASQVCTENAIGAISRGKQVIITGDSKQLPPTNFFNSTVTDYEFDNIFNDEDDDYDYDTYAYESILDEANLLPEKTLLWHYRSRHEHLIAFSNYKIYKNNLITFPSNVDRVPDNGVEYEYIPNGIYDRGGKRGNIEEAKKVADLVFEHFKNYPKRSLGVITFGEVQQQAIENIIRQRRMENQEFEVFFKEDIEEPFFIKNLENVQGDERDTIIFSIGYAKDANGVFRMNFGPLSLPGGERRLNVAITRAKYNVKLVGSILPTDILVEKITNDGPKLLRSYIEFAKKGPEIFNSEVSYDNVRDHDSPFEAAVYDFLDRKGYKIRTQVGCSGYRIDMAVMHPNISGEFILGIECDGAAYHSARTARERDRLRQDVLENMGWTIYRIWSTDWIKDPRSEGKKLIDAIEDALKNYDIENPIKREKMAKLDENYLSVKRTEYVEEDDGNPYKFDGEESLNLEKRRYYNIDDEIYNIIEKTFPIHYDILIKESAPVFGNQNITQRVKDGLDDSLNNLSDKIVKIGDFYYPAKYKKILPKNNNTRRPEYVSSDEIAAAMYYIINKHLGISKNSLFDEIVKSYNFSKVNEVVTTLLNNAYNVLLREYTVKPDKDDNIFGN